MNRQARTVLGSVLWIVAVAVAAYFTTVPAALLIAAVGLLTLFGIAMLASSFGPAARSPSVVLACVGMLFCAAAVALIAIETYALMVLATFAAGQGGIWMGLLPVAGLVGGTLSAIGGALIGRAIARN